MKQDEKLSIKENRSYLLTMTVVDLNSRRLEVFISE